MSFRRNRTERAPRGRGRGPRLSPPQAESPSTGASSTASSSLYGRMVAAGEWRDYAIDFLKDRAVFSVFRRASEVPIYRIEKNPKLARRQGAYSVISATGLIVRRGHELDRVLRALDKSLQRGGGSADVDASRIGTARPCRSTASSSRPRRAGAASARCRASGRT